MVKNGDEFAIPGILCDQDDLQLITYWWGENYFDHCMAHDDGAFLETHDFPQTITPLSEDCGGHVLLARPASTDCETTVEIMAVHIPFGYTMILGKNTWHGDMGLKGLHVMAMTANHLIMEGTTKSWFLKHENLPQRSKATDSETFESFKYRVQYGVGSRESNGTQVAIPAELQSLVSCTLPCTRHDEKVRHERWDMMFDEGIRKYAPWSTPSSERVAVAAQDARSFAKNPFRPRSGGESVHVSKTDTEKVYMDHQRDLAHRFNHGAVQLYDSCELTVGPMNPYWMLRLPRSGHWRYVIDRVVGRTVAGTVSFTLENVMSDSIVGDLQEGVLITTADGHSLDVVSQGPEAAVMGWSDVLLDSYPDPEIAHDGLSELTVTVVTHNHEDPHESQERYLFENRPRATISLFFGLIKFQK